MATKELKEKLAQKAQQVGQQTQVVTDPRRKMTDLLSKMEGQFKKALASTITPEKFTRIALSLYNNNQAFWACDDVSFLSALMLSAQAGLEPNTILGQAYLIPYGGKVTFQVGYKGILELAHRTRLYKEIYALPVYKEDEFKYSYGLHKDLIHVPADIQSGDPTHYYAVYKTVTGAEDFVVWSRDKVVNHAKKYSKTFNNRGGAWQSSFDSMALKTVIIDVLKFAPKSTEIAKVMAFDDNDQEEVKSQIFESTKGDEDLGIVLDMSAVVEANYEVKEETQPAEESGADQGK